MKTIIVDDSRFHLMQLAYELTSFDRLDVSGTFTCPLNALHFSQQHRVDLAFIKIPCLEMSERSLIDGLLENNSSALIVFISDEKDDFATAADMGAEFLLRPYTHLSLERAVLRAAAIQKQAHRRIFIKTFGSFGVFVDGVPLRFPSAKAQELLAYLVDRNGNVVDTREGFSVLWEDKCFCSSSSSCYRKVLSRLLSTLEDAGIPNILRIYTRGRAINKSVVDCDYYSYLDGNREVIKGWNGEYMTNYSWAEPTLGWLHENRKNYYSSL